MIAKALGGGIEAGRISAGMCMPLRAALDWLDVVLSSYAYYM